jgi:CHASE2 domain-containing sensor protein
MIARPKAIRVDLYRENPEDGRRTLGQAVNTPHVVTTEPSVMQIKAADTIDR